MMSMPLWMMALASPAQAGVSLTPTGFMICPPYGQCIQNLRTIDGAWMDWDDLRLVTDEGTLDPVRVRIELQLIQGSVELWVDGALLDPRHAEEGERGTYAWVLPVTARRDLEFETVNLVSGLSIYQVSVEPLFEAP